MVAFSGHEIKLYGIRLKLSKWYLYGCIYLYTHILYSVCVCTYAVLCEKIVARNDGVPDEIEKK